ncbi:hypothetical protein DFH08DRAFT_977854 [Mycena albidolilacea]|uniref:Uncharacterized protein n=1 Tax=Mycena albidolilacea TaxID=1033008 RepID=A0AAD7E8R0_9AGAR|nr:hypothetical protein DFH08DRAFT_977854 [Mycena albidolilacea]
MRTPSVIPSASGERYPPATSPPWPTRAVRPSSPEVRLHTLETATAVLSATCSNTPRASARRHRSVARRASPPRVPRLFSVPLYPWSKFSPPTSAVSRSGFATRSHCAAPPACAACAPGTHHSRRRSCPAFILPHPRYDPIVQHHLYAQHAQRPLSIPAVRSPTPVAAFTSTRLTAVPIAHQRPLPHFAPGLSIIAYAALVPSHRARRENAAADGQRATQPQDRHTGRAERLRARREHKRSAYSITASAREILCTSGLGSHNIFSTRAIALCYFPILLLQRLCPTRKCPAPAPAPNLLLPPPLPEPSESLPVRAAGGEIGSNSLVAFLLKAI